MKKGTNKNKKSTNNTIGILLLMPLYIAIFTLFFIFKLHGMHDYVLLPIFMYIPILTGVILAYKTNKKKFNKLLGFLLIFFCAMSCYFFIDTYFVINHGWKSVSQYLLWLINTGVCRVIACLFYAKIVGYRKSIIMFLSYLAIIVISYTLGFWA